MRRALVLLLSAVLLLGGCSLFGGDDDAGDGPGSEDAAAEESGIAPTAWREAEADEVAAGGTLRLAVTSLPATFNPAHAEAERSELARLLGPTNGGAVRITPRGSWQVDPDYARSVEVVEEDPLQVRVELNPDAVWQGGSAITARDMEAFWQAMNGSDDDYEVSSTEGYDAIESVEEGDDEFEYTVTFDELRSDWPLYVYPRLPANVSDDAEAFNEDFQDRPVSANGPFVTTDIDLETGTITQERNPRWWGEEPKLESVVWRVAALDVQAEAYAAEELDVITLGSSTIRSVDEEQVQRASGSQLTQLTLNAGRGALAEREVRRAVALGLDRTAVAEGTNAGLGVPPVAAGSLLLLPGQSGYRDAATRSLSGGAEEARSLLEDAGFEMVDGLAERDGEPLTLSLPVPSGSPSVATRAKQVKADLAEIGITVRLPRVPPEDFSSSVLLPLDFDLVTFTWGPSLLGPQTAERRFRPIDSSANFTGRATGADDNWTAAGEELDDDDRREAVRTLDENLLEQAVMVPLSVVPVVMAVREGVVNYGAASFETPDWTVVGRAAE